MAKPEPFKTEKEFQNYFRVKLQNFAEKMELPKIIKISTEYWLESNSAFIHDGLLQRDKKLIRRADFVISHVDGSISIIELKNFKEAKGSRSLDMFTGMFQLLQYKTMFLEMFKPVDGIINNEIRLFLISNEIDKESAKLCHLYSLPIRFIYATRDGFDEYFISGAKHASV